MQGLVLEAGRVLEVVVGAGEGGRHRVGDYARRQLQSDGSVERRQQLAEMDVPVSSNTYTAHSSAQSERRQLSQIFRICHGILYPYPDIFYYLKRKKMKRQTIPSK